MAGRVRPPQPPRARTGYDCRGRRAVKGLKFEHQVAQEATCPLLVDRAVAQYCRAKINRTLRRLCKSLSRSEPLSQVIDIDVKVLSSVDPRAKERQDGGGWSK